MSRAKAKVTPTHIEVRRILVESGLEGFGLERMVSLCTTVLAAQAYADGRRRRESVGL